MLGTRSNLYIRSLKTGERRNQRKTERNFLICIANGSTRRRHLNSTFGTICIHLFEVKICDILIIQTICLYQGEFTSALFILLLLGSVPSEVLEMVQQQTGIFIVEHFVCVAYGECWPLCAIETACMY